MYDSACMCHFEGHIFLKAQVSQFSNTLFTKLTFSYTCSALENIAYFNNMMGWKKQGPYSRKDYPGLGLEYQYITAELNPKPWLSLLEYGPKMA